MFFKQLVSQQKTYNWVAVQVMIFFSLKGFRIELDSGLQCLWHLIPTMHFFLINGRIKIIGLVDTRSDTIAPKSLFMLG